MTNTKIIAVTLGLVAYGWALVHAAETRQPEGDTHYEVFVERAMPQGHVATPVADSLVDWVEHDRQNDCLWEHLQASGVEITLQAVMAAGVWTDALGGACLVIGEDDE